MARLNWAYHHDFDPDMQAQPFRTLASCVTASVLWQMSFYYAVQYKAAYNWSTISQSPSSISLGDAVRLWAYFMTSLALLMDIRYAQRKGLGTDVCGTVVSKSRIESVTVWVLITLQNTHHVLQPYLPERSELCYNLRNRTRNKLLINKPSHLNDGDFIICMLYKDSYWQFLLHWHYFRPTRHNFVIPCHEMYICICICTRPRQFTVCMSM